MRIRQNAVTGTLTAALAAADTEWSDAQLTAFPTLTPPDIIAVTFDVDKIAGPAEIVWITAHTAGSAAVTILRGQEGTTARDHASGIKWAHAPTVKDFEEGTSFLAKVGLSVGDGASPTVTVTESGVAFGDGTAAPDTILTRGAANRLVASGGLDLPFGTVTSGGQVLATEAYVDAAAAGQRWKDAVACATTANITLSGEQTIDGIATSGSRVLVKNQTTQSANGIYVSAAGAWARSADADTTTELDTAAVFVSAGTVNANSTWVQTTNSPTVGTSAIVWAQTAGGSVTAGSGLTKTGNTISVATGGITSAMIQDATVGVGDLGTTGTRDGTKFLRDDFVWTGLPPAGATTFSNVRYCHPAGNDTNDGSSWNQAKLTANAAVRALPKVGVGTSAPSHVGTVYFGPGIIYANATVPINRHCALIGVPSGGGQGVTSTWDGYGTTIKAGNNTNLRGVIVSDETIDGSTFGDWSHHVNIKWLNVDGNRANNPGGGYGVILKKSGFQTGIDTFTVKECRKAGIYLKSRSVNFHGYNLGVTHCGMGQQGITTNVTTDTFTYPSVHGLEVGDPVMFRDIVSTTGINSTDIYFVESVPTTTTFKVSATKSGGAVNLTGSNGSVTLVTPGGMIVEYELGANGCLVTIDGMQNDDNDTANIIAFNQSTSRNHKLLVRGIKSENKDGTRTTGITVGAGTPATFTKTAHGFVNGDVFQVFALVNVSSGLNDWGRYYVVNKTTNTFQLAIIPGGSAIAVTTSGSATMSVQEMGGGAYCHRDVILVDQREATNGLTVRVDGLCSQIDGAIGSEAPWTAVEHSLVRLLGASETLTAQTQVVLDAVNTASTTGYQWTIDDFARNGVRVGDPTQWASWVYHGVPSNTTPAAVMFGQAGILTGDGDPSAAGSGPLTTAGNGSLYLRTGGSPAGSLWIKKAGTWTAFTNP